MNTHWLLIAQYQGRSVIPLEEVCRDYFWHLTPAVLLRKVNAGAIKLPIVRMERDSQKTSKGVHIEHLAAYIDERKEAAAKECAQLNR